MRTKVVDMVVAMLDARTVALKTDKDDFPSTTEIVDAMGPLLVSSNEADVRRVIPALARLLDTTRTAALSTGVQETQPLDPEAPGAAMGVFWTLNSLLRMKLEEDVEARRQLRMRPRRLEVLDVVRAGVASMDLFSPSAFLRSPQAERANLRADEVSRALGELLKEGVVEVVPPLEATDRRLKFFRSTQSGASTSNTTSQPRCVER